jgi:shikimate kinase
MGSGKSTVGDALAQRLGWPMSDSDREIEASTGRTARETKDELGADAIHRLEAEHLLAALAQEGPTVVCAAASTVEDERCRQALHAPPVLPVWLRASPAALAQRFTSIDAHRPAYGDDPARFLASQAKRRNPLFAEVARLTIDADGRSAEDVAQAILDGAERAREAP